MQSETDAGVLRPATVQNCATVAGGPAMRAKFDTWTVAIIGVGDVAKVVAEAGIRNEDCR